MADTLNTTHVYAVKLSQHIAQCMNISTKVNGHVLDAGCSDVPAENGLPPAKINSKELEEEEAVRETFGHFGAMESIILPSKPEKRLKHACISK